MIKLAKLLPAAALLLALMCVGCEQPSVEGPSTGSGTDGGNGSGTAGDGGITVPYGDTIYVSFSFSPSVGSAPEAFTRATASEAAVTDIWLMDYQGGELQQTVHQQMGADGFGTIALRATYGTHALHIIGSAGTEPQVDGDVITWARVGDTFYSADTIDVQPQASNQVAAQLRRVASRLRITVTDVVPATFARLAIGAQWYFGFNARTGEACSAQQQVRSVSVPQSLVGTSGQLSAGFYTLCPAAGYSCPVTVSALDANGQTLHSVTLTSVPFARNKITTYQGELLQNTRSVSLDFDTTWGESLGGSW